MVMNVDSELTAGLKSMMMISKSSTLFHWIFVRVPFVKFVTRGMTPCWVMLINLRACGGPLKVCLKIKHSTVVIIRLATSNITLDYLFEQEVQHVE